MTGADPLAFANDRDRVRPQKMADMVANRIRRTIASGELRDGEWLPTEPALMEQFGVSRPTLREAFRLLEADSLVSIRRGPPGGARVTIPGSEAAAGLFGLLLTLSGTTVRDVYEARMTIEPSSARRLAERGTTAGRKQLAAELGRIHEAAEERENLTSALSRFPARMVELSGNHTLGMVVGMLTEIIDRQLTTAYREGNISADAITANNQKTLRAYEKLVELVSARDGEQAEQFWLKHMRSSRAYVLKAAIGDTQVVDLLH